MAVCVVRLVSMADSKTEKLLILLTVSNSSFMRTCTSIVSFTSLVHLLLAVRNLHRMPLLIHHVIHATVFVTNTNFVP